MVTEGLIARYRVDRVISIGVAGSLAERSKESEVRSQESEAEGFRIGDVFIATNVVSHQAGKETGAGFQPQEPSAVSHQPSAEYLRKCEELHSNAVEVARTVLQAAAGGTPTPPDRERLTADSRLLTASLRSGKLVSGDSFIASSSKRKWLHETYGADAVDMVSAGIARVCEANGVPFVIIRVLSDNADESASQDFAAFVQASKESVSAAIAVRLIDEIAHSKGKTEVP